MGARLYLWSGPSDWAPAAWRASVVKITSRARELNADGVIVEVHPYPDKALSDGRQSLNLQLFADMMRGLERFVPKVEPEPALVA